ncbi:hypothetical protein EDC01DRAFT_653699 [Geopyxis carbonaria]|nr:hypothetical protein EDC01DRAFT_653699 [Geopyxis carbonaria]
MHCSSTAEICGVYTGLFATYLADSSLRDARAYIFIYLKLSIASNFAKIATIFCYYHHLNEARK